MLTFAFFLLSVVLTACGDAPDRDPGSAPTVHWIDVRSPEEYAGGHREGVNIPHDEIDELGTAAGREDDRVAGIPRSVWRNLRRSPSVVAVPSAVFSANPPDHHVASRGASDSILRMCASAAGSSSVATCSTITGTSGSSRHRQSTKAR